MPRPHMRFDPHMCITSLRAIALQLDSLNPDFGKIVNPQTQF